MVVIGWWLDWMTLKFPSNPDGSVVLCDSVTGRLQLYLLASYPLSDTSKNIPI